MTAALPVGVEITVSEQRNYEAQFARNGWSVCPVGAIGDIHAPDGQNGQGLYISVVDSDGVTYASGQPWNSFDLPRSYFRSLYFFRFPSY